MARLVDLPDFCTAHAALPHVWGDVDCCLVLADWALANGHADGAAHLRGTYATADACFAVVEAAGGLVPLVGGIAAGLGLAEIETVQPGCIAIIGSRQETRKQWGAIFDGANWRVRQPEGFIETKARAIRMWAI